MEKKKEKVNKKDYLKITKKLLKYVLREWKLFLLTLVLVISSNILILWGPRLSGAAIDSIANTPIDFDKTKLNIFLMLLAYLGSSLLTYISTRVMIRVSENVIVKMRQDTFDKIVDLPIKYIDEHQTGDLVSRISYDLDVVNQVISNNVVSIIASIITVVGSFYMMLTISPNMTIIFLLVIPITTLFTVYRVKKTRPLFAKRSKKLGEMNGYVEEMLNGQKTIQAYEKENFFSSEFRNINDESIDAYYKADYQASINFPTMMLITNLSIGIVSIFGSLMYLSGNLTLGFLSSFVMYSRQFSFPINQIAGVVAEVQSAYSAANRVFTLLEQDNEKPDAADAIELKDIKGKVEFKNVSFGYNDDKMVIKDFNYVAKPGTLTAIVGHTGAGKTTLINLLMRFYDPQEGDILIDDISYKKIKRKSQRAGFSMVLQDTWLFNGTIKDNITYGRPDASMEEVKRAARAAHIDHFIELQEDGYNTILDEEAANLSQGQKQLLTIARAMLLNSSMLILDEATSNVDSRTEIQIQDAMNKLMENKTSFVIAHRLSTIKNADIILLMKNGEIIERGTHEELLNNKGKYYNLYNSQFIKSE
ncbi:ABC transporter ATP-binding protein [Helcococcus kunzii]|uniref:ABC transporter ATP-binding protein n=1 Tax=Helcococcus kunzii TaxID=40091 RepID=UPI0021A56BF0|nr:ABC transporter ATP-binding protein [Helcococcus kunzii]MCT1796688.1 ABC transporter ATP-binding protein/permease [Helcococcus kunzii]MCT1989092.1 ABC transporter ATP-binding protein/permease [Helcococcus kunzii]